MGFKDGGPFSEAIVYGNEDIQIQDLESSLLSCVFRSLSVKWGCRVKALKNAERPQEGARGKGWELGPDMKGSGFPSQR